MSCLLKFSFLIGHSIFGELCVNFWLPSASAFDISLFVPQSHQKFVSICKIAYSRLFYLSIFPTASISHFIIIYIANLQPKLLLLQVFAARVFLLFA